MLHPSLQNGFGVRRRAVRLRPERAAHGDVVIDLTVVGDPGAGSGVGHRLVTGVTQVEDGEARVGQAEATAGRRGDHLNAGVVRPAVAQGALHPHQERW